MHLDRYVNTFGRAMQKRHGRRIHKIAINAGMSCPNIDGTKARGGCTFCNNASFSPNAKKPDFVEVQIREGKAVIKKRTGAREFIAYFQAYTNTHADVAWLKKTYDAALRQPEIVGISVGTRPDCLPDAVLRLLADYQDRGMEVWLELGLQSASDATLNRVNRGHSFAEYEDAVTRANAYGLQVCTHLMFGLPGESAVDYQDTYQKVMAKNIAGIKLHPVNVVRGTQLAKSWRKGEYQPMQQGEYVELAADLVRQTDPQIVFHRLMATAPSNLLLAPAWCARKWDTLNAIGHSLARSCSS